MRIRIVSWGGASLNNSDFETTVAIGQGNGALTAMPNYIDMGENDPVLGSKTLQGASFTFHVNLKGVTDAALEIQRDALFAMFRANDPEIKTLLGEDTEDGDAEWYLLGTSLSAPLLVEQAINRYSVTIALDSAYWQKIIPETTSFNIGSTTEDNEVDPGGNLPVPPIIEITPQAAKGSPVNANRFFVGVHPPEKPLLSSATRSYYYKRPINLTPDGLDTAALVLAGKMRSDGNDLRVLVDGVEVPRFFGTGTKAMNTATTHVWVYLTMPMYTPFTLVTSLDGSTTPSSIQIDMSNTAFEDAIDKVPADLLIGSEIITYTGFTKALYPNSTAANRKWRCTLTGITRAAKGTSMAAHSPGASVDRFHNDIWIVYGNPSATAPDPKTDWIPSFDLEQSTNDEWVYDGQFTAAGAPPTQAFTFPPVMNGPGELYTAEENVGSSDLNNTVPWEVLGLRLASKVLSGIVYSDTTSRPLWRFADYHVLIDSVEYAGQRKRTGAESGVVTLGYLLERRGQYIPLVTIDNPVAVDTWEPFSGTIDLSTYDSYVFFMKATGGLGTTLPAPEMLVELNYVKIIHAPAEVPVIYIPSAEASSYELSGYIENVENGHRIVFKEIPMLTGDTLTIDCAEMTATLSDGRNARGYLEFTGTVRDEWMLMINGSNTIRYYDLNTTDVDVEITTTPRNTI